MESDFLILSIGIALAGYFIGNGLKNFKNPDESSSLESIDDFDGHELIKESDVHYFMGISKSDAKSLLQDHPDIPHVIINNKVFYPKAKLREWLMNIGE